MKKSYAMPVLLLLFVFLTGMVSFAGEYSSAWYQENGNWHVKGPDGQPLKNCWFCDDAVFSNGKNIWYLLDGNGDMVASPLVRDRNGNYYSLETDHSGHYGALRFQSGYYDEIPMTFSQQHDGTFGALVNAEAIEQLKLEYGVRDISAIDSNNCVYSSSWLGVSGTPSANLSTAVGPGGSGTVTADDVVRTIRYWRYGKTVYTDKGIGRTFTVWNLKEEFFEYWTDSLGNQYYPGDIYYFEGNFESTIMVAHFSDN